LWSIHTLVEYSTLMASSSEPVNVRFWMTTLSASLTFSVAPEMPPEVPAPTRLLFEVTSTASLSAILLVTSICRAPSVSSADTSSSSLATWTTSPPAPPVAAAP
jgi:hypothetical protein